MQYIIIYTVLAFVWTGNQFTNNSYLGVRTVLEKARTTRSYATMLSVFLAARLRAIQLTQDESNKYKISTCTPRPQAQTATFC